MFQKWREFLFLLGGKIATVDAEVNENVGSGQQIVVLSSEGDLEVNLGLPESYISNVNVLDKVEVIFFITH